MIATRLDWPAKPRRSEDRNFGRRQTWRDRESGYLITRIPDVLPDEFALHFPRWAQLLPRRFRTLAAAQRWAQRHRNGEFET
jgi:hypothetical protein